LRDHLAVRLEELFRSCCLVNGWSLEELNIQEDHVHLLLQLPTDVSVARACKLLKGGSSFVLHSEFPTLEVFLWGKNFWGVGYFAESVGSLEEATIRRYIRNQSLKT
jgi:putative transposase